MLSDSICQAIQDLLKEIEHYSLPPFEYGIEFKEQFIVALANLYFVLHSIDGYGDNIDMLVCSAQARTEIENIYSKSN